MPIPRRALLAALASLPVLSRPAFAARTPGVLTFGLSAFPPNLQPWVYSGAASGTVKLLIYRGLLSFGPDGALRGELAESWEHDGGAVWTFKLRQVHFQNGDPLTSSDVKWSIEHVAAPTSTAYFRSEMQSIIAIDTPDDRTVRLTTKTPSAVLPQWFANSNMPILSRTAGERNPSGIGPFTLTSQERGNFIELEAAKDFYRPGLPKLKGVRLVAYADDSARVAALQSGDVDIIEYVPWQSLNTLGADPALRIDEHDGPFMYLQFNAARGPFADARIRQAVAHAINRSDIVKAAFFGRGSALEHLPIPNASPFFNPDLEHAWNFDPARAKQLLADAGQPNGFECTLLSTAQYGMHKDTAEVVQQHLAAIGIQAKLNLPDWATRVRLGNQGQFDLGVMGTGPDTNDPDGLGVVIDGSLPPSFLRSFGLKTPKVTAMLEAGRAEFDQDKRRAIYHQMEQAALEEVPIVGLTWRDQAYAMRKEVSGFTNMPGMLTFLSGVTLETTSLS